MGDMHCIVRAREKVLVFLSEAELDRFVVQACAAAECFPSWHAGDEFIFEIDEEPHVIPGIERSAMIVRHLGSGYEVLYYNGPIAETIQ
jgi:hypothetical protein